VIIFVTLWLEAARVGIAFWIVADCVDVVEDAAAFRNQVALLRCGSALVSILVSVEKYPVVIVLRYSVRL